MIGQDNALFYYPPLGNYNYQLLIFKINYFFCNMICLFSFTQGIFGVGQSTAKVYNKETSVKVRFK